MSLAVNTNVSSLTAHRSLAKNETMMSQAMTRLSTGSKINSASDDAAGLAIVERMTSQIKGLNMAVKNANDGIGLTKSIEGALVEVTDMLQRLRELAIQSANDTNSGVDRGYIQEEVNLLQAELTRVSSNTRYNGIKVLDGNFTTKHIHVGAEAQERITISTDSVAANQLGAYKINTIGVVPVAPHADVPTSTIAGGTLLVMGGGVSETLTVAAAETAKATAAKINGVTGTTGVTASARTYATLAFTATSAQALAINGTTIGSFNASATSVSDAVIKINAASTTTGVTATANSAGSAVILFDADGDDITLENNNAAGTMTVQTLLHDGTTTSGAAATLAVAGSTHSTRVVGNIEMSSSNTFSINISAAANNLNNGATTAAISSVDAVDLSTQAGADSAIDVLDGAIEKISSMRAELGAIENRLSHTVSNLMNVSEQTENTRSLLQDADFAVESSNLSKAQVLMQAATAMLAQANARPQLALQLLQG
jgi:flagellin